MAGIQVGARVQGTHFCRRNEAATRLAGRDALGRVPSLVDEVCIDRSHYRGRFILGRPARVFGDLPLEAIPLKSLPRAMTIDLEIPLLGSI